MSFTGRIFVLNIHASGADRYFIRSRSVFRLSWEDMSPRGSFLAVSGVRHDGTGRLSCYTTHYLTTEHRTVEEPGFSRAPDGTSPFISLLQTPARELRRASCAFPGIQVGQVPSRHHCHLPGYAVLADTRDLSPAFFRSDDCMILSARQIIQSSDRPHGSEVLKS